MSVFDRITFGVDQATASGWSIHRGRAPLDSGVLDVWNWEERRRVLRLAFDLQNEDRMRRAQGGGYVGWVPEWFAFAYEDHGQAPLKSYKSTPQVLGLGKAFALWWDSLNRLGHPEALRIGITSRSWRAKVLGLKASEKRDECKYQAKVWASAHVGKPIEDEDEAEAICVSAWGALDGVQEIERRRYETAAKALR